MADLNICKAEPTGAHRTIGTAERGATDKPMRARLCPLLKIQVFERTSNMEVNFCHIRKKNPALVNQNYEIKGQGYEIFSHN